jgi:hypothetical protein
MAKQSNVLDYLKLNESETVSEQLNSLERFRYLDPIIFFASASAFVCKMATS